MKRILVLYLLMLPVTGWCGGRELEGLLRELVVSGVAKKNPGAGKVLGVVLAPKTSISAGDNYSNPTQGTQMYPEPRSARDFVVYGKMLGNAGDVSGALSMFVRAIELEPDDIEAHYCAGVAYFKLGDPARAREEYGRAMRLRVVLDKKLSKLFSMIEDGRRDAYEQER